MLHETFVVISIFWLRIVESTSTWEVQRDISECRHRHNICKTFFTTTRWIWTSKSLFSGDSTTETVQFDFEFIIFTACLVADTTTFFWCEFEAAELYRICRIRMGSVRFKLELRGLRIKNKLYTAKRWNKQMNYVEHWKIRPQAAKKTQIDNLTCEKYTFIMNLRATRRIGVCIEPDCMIWWIQDWILANLVKNCNKYAQTNCNFEFIDSKHWTNEKTNCKRREKIQNYACHWKLRDLKLKL